MFTPSQCQDSAQAVSRGKNMNASRAVSRAMSSYHHGAVGAIPPGSLRLR